MRWRSSRCAAIGVAIASASRATLASAQRTGPLDDLRAGFVTAAGQHTFSPSSVAFFGKVVAIDRSRAALYESPNFSATVARLGGYLETVTFDDGVSSARAACSVFGNERGRSGSLADPRIAVAAGTTLHVRGTFIGALIPGAVEMLACTAGSASDMPPANATGNPSRQIATTSEGSLASGPPIDAATLLALAKNDPASFRARYGGRSVAVTARVERTFGVAARPNDTHGVVFFGRYPEDGRLYCLLAPDALASLQLARDNIVTVAGTFGADPYFDGSAVNAGSKIRDAQLRSCRVVDTHPAIPASMRIGAAKSLGASTTPLSGLFLSSRFEVLGGLTPASTTTFSFLYCFPDGRIYDGVPANNLRAFDYAAAAARDPERTGYYRTHGTTIDIVWSGSRKADHSDFARASDGFQMLGATWYRARTEGLGTNWLHGDFRHQMGASAGNNGALALSGYAFGRDGTFTATRSSAVLNGTLAQANRSTNSSLGGTFTTDGTALTLKFSDGHVETHSTFPYASHSIFIDGALFIGGA